MRIAKYFLCFLIGFVIASVLMLNFMEYCHLDFEHRLHIGDRRVFIEDGRIVMWCFSPQHYVENLIGEIWGYRVKRLYKLIVLPTKINFKLEELQ